MCTVSTGLLIVPGVQKGKGYLDQLRRGGRTRWAVITKPLLQTSWQNSHLRSAELVLGLTYIEVAPNVTDFLFVEWN